MWKWPTRSRLINPVAIPATLRRDRSAYTAYAALAARVRAYSSGDAASSLFPEDVVVRTRSNGSITLNIHRPLVVAANPPIILYLPPGPIGTGHSHPDVQQSAASVLCSAASAIVVQVNYRLSEACRFPTPVHDVLHGYDFVLEHLVPDRAIARAGRSGSHAMKIGVCGELVGGGLAAMLALTECRPGGPHIAAAALNEPIVDWVFPEQKEVADDGPAVFFDAEFTSHASPLQSTKRRKSSKIVPSFTAFGKNDMLSATALLNARNAYFGKPEHYFDPFASPTLFFRTAGVDVPVAPPVKQLDEFDELARFEREDFDRASNVSPLLAHVDTAEDAPKISPRRTSKRWPNAGSGLMLPDFRISFGHTSPLSDQAAEMTMLIRRSVLSQYKKAGTKDQTGDDEEQRQEAFAYAERRAQVSPSENMAFWDGGAHHELRETASWFQSILG